MLKDVYVRLLPTNKDFRKDEASCITYGDFFTCLKSFRSPPPLLNRQSRVLLLTKKLGVRIPTVSQIKKGISSDMGST